MRNKQASGLCKRALCALLAFLSLISFHSSQAAFGQSRDARKKRGQSASRRKSPPRNPASLVPRPVVYESTGSDPFRSGDVYVRATQNSHMTVPIGMSRSAPVLVEFLADDPLYSIHEGNAKLAYVNCGQQADGTASASVPRQCNLRPNDPLVLQAGDDFVAPSKDEAVAPSTVITVQRVSGMVISFVIYFVPDPSRNANRVVVSYDLKEVLDARHKAGLMTQLVPASELAQAGVPETSPLVTPSPKPSPAQPAPNQQPVLPAQDSSTVSSSVLLTENKAPEDLLSEQTVSELQRTAASNPQLNFSKPVHGLALAILPAPPPTSTVTIQIVAVRNVTTMPLRLLPDQPELRITQSAKKGEAVTDQTLPVKNVATTVAEDNVLKPGEVYYFAIAYELPALSVRQSLYASFAHMLAADEPVSAPITFQLATR